jgi:hypothetical protein
MSDADITKSPPPNAFVADEFGVTRWRAELDGITVRRVFKGVLVETFEGDRRIAHTVTSEVARHLGRLLIGAAE